MCLNVEIILPTVKKFLLLYSLKTGCIFTLLWTTIRSIFCVLFFFTALLEVVVGKPFPLKPIFGDLEVGDYYTVYFSYVFLLLAEFMLMMFTIHLGLGICTEDLLYLRHYLICRIVTWAFEVMLLPVLCIAHKPLIGWYLGILFFVVLEFYVYIIVYSYYCTLHDDQDREKECDDID